MPTFSRFPRISHRWTRGRSKPMFNAQRSMHNAQRLLTAVPLAIALSMVAVSAQQQGRAGGAPAEENFPTAEQFANSKAAQAHVAAAMKIGGSDMADTAKWFCTATGPQRLALARQAQGLP